MSERGFALTAARVWSLILAALALTGAYLVGPARSRMDTATAVLLLFHAGLGLLGLPAVLVWMLRRTPRGVNPQRAGESDDSSRQRWAAGCWLLGAAYLTGTVPVLCAARGRVAPEAALAAHEAVGFGALALLGSVLAGRFVGRENAGRLTAGRPLITRQLAPHGALLLLLLLLGFLGAAAALTPNHPAGVRYQSEEYYAALTATNARQANNPLFPAGVHVRAEAGARVRSSAYCGAAGCHPSDYHQWWGSAHQRAGVDPAYLRSVARFQNERGATAGRWCEGCHAPMALIAAGSHGVEGAPDLRHRSPDSSARGEGVSCLTCHATARVSSLSGNGQMDLSFPSEYPFAEHPDPGLRWLHGFLIRLRPGPHRWSFMKPEVHARSEFCAACHRMSYNLPQNGYKLLRTEDEYGSWQMGPYSGQSIHGFSLPGPVRQCQDCHRAHRGGIQAVRQSGIQVPTSPRPEHPNTRTPEHPSPVTVDLLALRRQPRMAGAPEQLVAPLDRAAPLLRSGETVTVDVVIRNHGGGHEFPASIGNAQETWLEFEVAEGSGRVLLRSGGSGLKGDIDPEAHTYGMVGLDRTGRRLEQGDFWNMVTPLYHRSILPGQPDLDRRAIQPGESDVIHYRFQVPRGLAGPIQLRARLWCRRPEDIRHDNLPIAEDVVTLPLAAGSSIGGGNGGSRSAGRGETASLIARSAPGVTDPGLPARFYEYGVGLILQGDLPRAQRAMRRVQDWAPGDAGGYLGLGRVYLTEGDLLAARAQFEDARRLAPNDPRPRAFLATTDRRMGQYDRALAALEPLVRAYPRDRLLWFDVGMCHYLTGQYERAARAFHAMLDIDPDDLAAHYNLMRCLRRLHRTPEARHEEVIYQMLREDDGAKQIGLTYLRRHPFEDREARTVHEHELIPVTSDER